MRDLRDCFQQIPPRFFRLEGFNANRELRPQTAENNFSAELRHHFRRLMDEDENAPLYKNLQFDMTILKTLREKAIEPDLVLHEEQYNQNKQEIYVEVKCRYNTTKDLTDDLDKLIIAISTELNFKYAVMMVINETLLRTKRIIREFVGDRFTRNDLRQLYLFHAVRGDGNGDVTQYTFENFLSIKNNG